MKVMKKPWLVKSELDKKIAELTTRTDQKILAIWACDCVERVLPYFEDKYPEDKRPGLAIKAARTWVSNSVFKMADVRKTALAAHEAAREVEEDDAARSAARAAGQALATAHVPGHAVAAAVYAATAARDGVATADADAAVAKEREWQYQHLIELREHKGEVSRGARSRKARSQV
jgi:hypothetical protein